MTELRQRVVDAFRSHFGEKPPLLVRAPGRVNLIGEHTDYNDGFVLPMAIDREVAIALRPRRDAEVKLFSLDFDSWGSFSLEALSKSKGWIEYPKGTAWALERSGYRLSGWEGVLAGDLPRGSGLSSSAAVELATARAFHEVSGFPWDPVAMARIGQTAENGWLGVNSGIMDQLISAAGREGHALLIDCRSLEHLPVRIPEGYGIAVLDTMTRRGLVESAYNERRSQCEQAARLLGVTALRDVSSEGFEARAAELPVLTRRRARHVVGENERTRRAAEAMERGDAHRLGELMNESHRSLRDDFEVSSPALNAIVEIAQAQQGCLGARMTGAGFGGCAVALVEEAALPTFIEGVRSSYGNRLNVEPEVYLCSASAGASSLKV